MYVRKAQDSDSFPGVNFRGMKKAKFIGRTKDIDLNYDRSRAPVGLRIREQFNLGPHKAITAD